MTSHELLEKTWNYLVYISPPTVGALTGVLLGGIMVQRYWVKKSNESLIIEYLAKELSDLVDETLEYWSLDCQDTAGKPEENRQQARKLEQKMKGAIKNLHSMLRQYSERYRKRGQADFTSLMAEVNDACTGGDFEGAKRPPDRDRFLVVVNATHRVRWQLLQRRV